MVPNLTLIQTFYHVARDGSYSAASRSLGLTYQSVANHVRKLEQVLNKKLVETEKGGKQIALTPRGRELFQLLHPELDIMLNRLNLLVTENRTVLRIGLPQAVFYYLFPQILQRFQKEHENIEIQAMERDTMLRELVRDGSLDVCISESYFGDPAVPQRLIGVYRMCLIFPAQWQKEFSKSDYSQFLATKPFVTYEPGQTLRNLAVDYLGQLGIRPTVSVSASGSSSVKKCVEEGLGYSIIPDWCLEETESRVCSKPIAQLPEVKVYFGHAEFLRESLLVQSLYEFCKVQISGAGLAPTH